MACINRKQWMILLLLVSVMPAHIIAQDAVNQAVPADPQQGGLVATDQMAPPPPGPYLGEQKPGSANIADPYQTQTDLSYSGSRHPAARMSQHYGPYGAPQSSTSQRPQSHGQPYYPAPAQRGYYPQYGQGYEQAYPPSYPVYPRYPQPAYPYGQQY